MNLAEKKISAEKPSFLSIQFLRGVAALMVVAHHATIMIDQRLGGGPGGRWLNGAAGVDIFFVISGFVMALSSRRLRATANPGRTFFKRRLERIVPLYWLATSIKVALLTALAGIAVNRLGNAWNIVASYLFIPSENSLHVRVPVLVVGWTLNYEMFFYVLFAMALGLRLRPLRFLTPVLLLLAIMPFVANPLPALLSLCDPILLEFLFGVVLYAGYEAFAPASRWWGLPAVAAGLTVLALSPGQTGSLFRPLIWGLPAFAVVAGCVEIEAWLRHLPRCLLLIGDASYSIYLSHTFVVPLLGYLLARAKVSGARTVLPVTLLAIAVCALVGIACYRLVEQPINAYFSRRRKVGGLLVEIK